MLFYLENDTCFPPFFRLPWLAWASPTVVESIPNCSCPVTFCSFKVSFWSLRVDFFDSCAWSYRCVLLNICLEKTKQLLSNWWRNQFRWCCIGSWTLKVLGFYGLWFLGLLDSEAMRCPDINVQFLEIGLFTTGLSFTWINWEEIVCIKYGKA